MKHTLSVLSILLLCKINKVYPQNDGKYPFVAGPFEPVNLDSIDQKVYRTTLSINSTEASINSTEASFNSTIFEKAGVSFYNGSDDRLKGFVDLKIISSPKMSTTFEVTYDVTYFYLTLNSSTGGSDDAIFNTIGNISAVKAGFENDVDFSMLYTVLIPGFNYGGSTICQTAINCQPGLTCLETINGINVACKSRCYDNFCLNGGWCIQTDAVSNPVCSCLVYANSWYVGNHCETLFELWMMILFLVIVGLILIVVIPLVTWLCIKGIDKRLLKEKARDMQKHEKNLKEVEDKTNKKSAVLARITAIVKMKEVSKKKTGKTSSQPVSSLRRSRVTSSNPSLENEENLHPSNGDNRASISPSENVSPYAEFKKSNQQETLANHRVSSRNSDDQTSSFSSENPIVYAQSNAQPRASEYNFTLGISRDQTSSSSSEVPVVYSQVKKKNNMTESGQLQNVFLQNTSAPTSPANSESPVAYAQVNKNLKTSVKSSQSKDEKSPNAYNGFDPNFNYSSARLNQSSSHGLMESSV